MYRARLWTMRQYAGFGDASATNARFRALLDRGMTGLSLAFDLPTQIGMDSDAELALGEVGRVGVAIDSVEDMARLFEGIDLGAVTTSMTINAPASVLLAMYLVVAEERGIGWERLGGTVQNDILKEYAARGTYIYPPEPSMRLTVDLMGFCAERVPKWNPISVSGYHIREAGATAAQEVAFTLGDAIAGQMSFFFSSDADFFEEIAKFRAARRMWAFIVRDRFGIDDERAQKLRFHCQTAGSTLAQREPDNNVVRVAYQALAAVLGGCQSLHANGRDEALSLPTEASARLALATQQILARETGVTAEPDPLGGAPFVEAMTDRLESEAREIMEWVDRLGGMTEAIGAGAVRRAIAESAYARQREFDSGERKIVGVNYPPESRATDDDDGAPRTAAEVFKLDENLEAEQVRRLETFRAGRDAPAAQGALESLRAAAQDSCRRSSKPCANARRSARSATSCAPSSGSIAKRCRCRQGWSDPSARDHNSPRSIDEVCSVRHD
jgi:methylmalonyl-CoA mutase N-terminal domain/subunit